VALDRRAIAAGNFVPYFQPIVRLTDSVSIGYDTQA